MRQTNPGIDRIEMISLRKLKNYLDGELARHIHLCHKCSTAGGSYYEKCEDWWLMAKQLHKLKRQLRVAEQVIPPGQDPLPGFE